MDPLFDPSLTESFPEIHKPDLGGDSVYNMFSRFGWDDLPHGELSQVLSPPDLFSLPVVDATTPPKDKLLNESSNWGLLSNPLFLDVLGPHVTSNPPLARQSDIAANFPTLSGLFNPVISGLKSDADLHMPNLFAPIPASAPVAPVPAPIATPSSPAAVSASSSKGGKKSKRKKGRPELQRKKRSEMNDRFKQLKLLCHPDTSASAVIGRGDRSTNSKEAILRIATSKIARLKKEIAQLERQAGARRAKARAQARSSQSSPSAETLDHTHLFRQSAIARLIMTLDGTIVACNAACAEMLDLTNKKQLRAVQKTQTVFTLAHPDTLPLIFQNLSLLLGGTQALTYIIDGKGPLTTQNRIPVWSAMSWISSGPAAAKTDGTTTTSSSGRPEPVYLESLIVQTGWTTPTDADLARGSVLSKLPADEDASPESTSSNSRAQSGSDDDEAELSDGSQSDD